MMLCILWEGSICDKSFFDHYGNKYRNQFGSAIHFSSTHSWNWLLHIYQLCLADVLCTNNFLRWSLNNNADQRPQFYRRQHLICWYMDSQSFVWHVVLYWVEASPWSRLKLTFYLARNNLQDLSQKWLSCSYRVVNCQMQCRWTFRYCLISLIPNICLFLDIWLLQPQLWFFEVWKIHLCNALCSSFLFQEIFRSF